MNQLTFIFSILMITFMSCSNKQESNLPPVDSEEALFEAMETNRQWPSYRGFHACGYLDRASLPDTFSVESGLNVKWNIEIPGLGLSCPVIWDDRIYLTTAISEADNSGYLPGLYGDIEPVADSSEHHWMVFCYDKKSGALLWEQEACKGIPMVKRHPKSSHANTSVATDGKHVVAFFGSEGLYCYDRGGKLLWKRDFGLINSAWNVVESAEWEFCSSPVIFKDRLIIQADALNTAFVAVLDLSTGETLWRKERDEISGWCTPNVYFQGGEARVAVNGYKHRGGYNLESGEEIWRMSGGGDVPIPTPIVWKDLIYFNSAHGRHAPLMAIKNSAEGEVSYPENDSVPVRGLEWFYDRAGAYMTSVLVYDSLLYRLRWNGNLACFDARSGDQIYQVTVNPSSFIASPVAADGKIYMVSELGELYIIESGSEYRLLKKIPLGEVSLVTPGLAPGMLLLRTASRLIAVSDG
ncbi:MAG: PQQ-binding-like beta-propeller repeat protein [Bacteroidetes bacterium]|nr:PQQ-binding-like beta-propeller repeat protein [Bacteroidota bacterium]